MPRERPRPDPFEPTSLARSLDRYLVVGLIFMTLLIAGFVAYRAREPGLRADAAQSQRVNYIYLGRGLFSTNCAECHGENGGGGGDAPTLASKEFLSSTTDAQSEALIAAGISGTDHLDAAVGVSEDEVVFRTGPGVEGDVLFLLDAAQ